MEAARFRVGFARWVGSRVLPREAFGGLGRDGPSGAVCLAVAPKKARCMTCFASIGSARSVIEASPGEA